MDEISLFLNALKDCKTVTLSSPIPYAKTQAISLIVNHFLSLEKQVHYLDFDLQFSSLYLNQESKLNRNLKLFADSGAAISDSIVELISSDSEAGGLVVLDGINSLQSLLREKNYITDSIKANHGASVLVTLLEQFASRLSKLLILTNLVRARPKSVEGWVSWGPELSGGRMIRLKSDAIVSVSNPSESPRSASSTLEARIELISAKISSSLEKELFTLQVASFT
ncbi:MAG: hypothetical protein ACYCQJ_04460 [Nitrososphaerales archaeon]